MTQQVDPRNPAVHDQTAGFEFQSHSGGPGGNNTIFSSAPDNSNNSGGNGDGSLGDRWPSLLKARQVVLAFILETASRSKPAQEKVHIVILQAWHLYLAYARAYPLATAFLSCLVVLSAVPILIFASITGASLGLLVGTAAVIVIIIQSIVLSIAGAILLFVLGSIVILTVFTFFWLTLGYFTFQFVGNVYESFKEQRLRHAQEERKKEQRKREEEDVHEWERENREDKEDTPFAAAGATREKEL